jgi:DNA-binding response OmpR family regulator
MNHTTTRHTVLLVEDEASDAALVMRAFDKAAMNSKVIRLSDGDQAVSYMRGDPPYHERAAYPLPSVILLDIKLPRRSGFEVIEWVREQQGPVNRTMIVMLTSSRFRGDVNRAYELGANSYLTKPDSSRQLVELAILFKEYWFRWNEIPDYRMEAV